MTDLHLHGHIDEKKARKVISALAELHNEDPEAPWDIVISSQGGYIVDGAAIYSEIFSYSMRGNGGHSITTRVRGQAASSASLVFQAGDLRLLGSADRIVIHEPTLSCEDMPLVQVEQLVSELRDWMYLYVTKHIERTELKRDYVTERIRGRDWIIHGDEAVALKLADGLG